MRSLVSYEDIAPPAPSFETSTQTPSGPPPKKKRKTSKKQKERREVEQFVEEEEGPKRPDYGISRQLTCEEIWDDSALIEAWDAAAEEYEVLNGPDKKWKSEPVNKSPLWYNIPPENPRPSAGPATISVPAEFASYFGDEEADQHDTSQDPLLQSKDVVPNGVVVPTPPVSSAEAFQNAMSAWYWAGYWTGVYNTLPKKPDERPTRTRNNTKAAASQEDSDASGDLIPT